MTTPSHNSRITPHALAQHSSFPQVQPPLLGHMFPRDFVWGTASSSFQIEGATDRDGRSPSIWDTLCQRPGAIADGSDGRVACDHYHRYEEDLDLMRDLGVRAYRFSIAWPRIVPKGRGAVEARGLAFYDRLVDGMLARGLEPFATLYHWDLPQALQDGGGWTQRDTAEAFVEYGLKVAEHFKGRIRHWVTHNEPWCVAVLGHRSGEHAPGLRDGNATLKAAHHVLLSHGLLLTQLRSVIPEAKIGIALNLTPAWAVKPTVEARRQAQIQDGDVNRWYLDPLLRGAYPEDMQRHYEAQGFVKEGGWSFIQSGDLDVISRPMDFLGVNFYNCTLLGRQETVAEQETRRQDPTRTTAMGWDVCPEGLEELLVRLHREYPVPAYYITENGAAYEDQVLPDGSINDQDRCSYYERHLEKLAAAVQRGVPVKGYFAWSIMDNFEWAFGYSRRFGLVHVDYRTQKRTPKRSYHWYREVVTAHRTSPAAGMELDDFSRV